MWDHSKDEAEYWRNRAEKARTAVPKLKSKASRQLMMEVAARYDELAAKAESKKTL
jgi:hypothetical protein